MGAFKRRYCSLGSEFPSVYALGKRISRPYLSIGYAHVGLSSDIQRGAQTRHQIAPMEARRFMASACGAGLERILNERTC